MKTRKSRFKALTPDDYVGLTAVAFLAAGLALIYVPAALIVLGILGLVWVTLGGNEAKA